MEKLSLKYSLGEILLDEYERIAEFMNKIKTDRELIILGNIINENGSAEIKNKPVKDLYTVLSYRKTPGSIINETDGKIITILGENHIIIHEDDLTKEENVINIKVILGETFIHIPENTIIINEAITKMGGEIIIKDKYIKKNKNKFLIIRGEAILGYITVKTN